MLEDLTEGAGADLGLGAMAMSPRGHGGHVTRQTIVEPRARWEKVNKPQNVMDCFCEINTCRVGWSQCELRRGRGRAGIGK